MGREVVVSAELVLDEAFRLSLNDACEACQINVESITAMIAEGVVDPVGTRPEEWYFDAVALRRMRTALRLQQDLGVNLAGAALVLDLLEELEVLRRKRGV